MRPKCQGLEGGGEPNIGADLEGKPIPNTSIRAWYTLKLYTLPSGTYTTSSFVLGLCKRLPNEEWLQCTNRRKEGIYKAAKKGT